MDINIKYVILDNLRVKSALCQRRNKFLLQYATSENNGSYIFPAEFTSMQGMEHHYGHKRFIKMDRDRNTMGVLFSPVTTQPVHIERSDWLKQEDRLNARAAEQNSLAKFVEYWIAVQARINTDGNWTN